MTITEFPITTRAATATGNELMTAANPAAARAAIGLNLGTVAVADAAARKNPASYTDPAVGNLRVIQTDLPGVMWVLVAADITLDASWLALPLLDAAGALQVGGVAIRELTTAEAVTDVPGDGEIVSIAGQVVVGDGERVADRILSRSNVVRFPQIAAPVTGDVINVVWDMMGWVQALNLSSTIEAIFDDNTGVGNIGDRFEIVATGSGTVQFFPVDYFAGVTFISEAGRYVFERVGPSGVDNSWFVHKSV